MTTKPKDNGERHTTDSVSSTEAHTNDSVSRLSKSAELIENIASTVVGFGAVATGLGFVVLSTNLAQYT